MDSPAPPPGQVRLTQVGGGEIPVWNTLNTSEHQSPSKGSNTNEKNETPATLTQRKDGSYQLVYSTKTDVKYNSHSARQWMNPVPKDFDMFGLQRSQWQSLLSCDTAIRTALTYDAETEKEQRIHQLNQVRKSELMYALRNLEEPGNHLYADREYKGKVYADYLTVQIADGFGTVNEQTAICGHMRKSQ